MGPVETELRRMNDLINGVYTEVAGRLPLMTGEQHGRITRELEAALVSLRAQYARQPNNPPTRQKILSDLSASVSDATLRSTIEGIINPPTPAWVRTLDYIQAQVLHMANIDPSMAPLLAPELGQAVQAAKTRFWFQPHAPTTAELLSDLRQRLTDTRLLAAVDQLLSPPASVPFRVEPPQPEQPATAPARRASRAGPSTSDLMGQGYTNVHTEGYYGMMITVAENAEGQARYLEIDPRSGQTRRELSSAQMDSIKELYRVFGTFLSEVESSIPNYSAMDFDTRAAINEEIERIANRIFARYARREIPPREELLRQFRSAARGEGLSAGLDALA